MKKDFNIFPTCTKVLALLFSQTDDFKSLENGVMLADMSSNGKEALIIGKRAYKMRYISRGIPFLASSSISESQIWLCFKSLA